MTVIELQKILNKIPIAVQNAEVLVEASYTNNANMVLWLIKENIVYIADDIDNILYDIYDGVSEEVIKSLENKAYFIYKLKK